MYNNINLLILSCIIVAGLIACDVAGEQNYDYEPGDSLNIVGPSSITEIPTTESYYVQGFTINKDYAWSVEGGASDSVYRSGEFVDLTFDEEGTYTLSVDDGEYEGSLEIEVVDTTS